jgi:hypothetical protein
MTLHAVPPPASPIFRVARGDDGPPTDPFAPPPWERADADGTFGNRFDDPGQADGIPEEERFRVVYVATQREGAFRRRSRTSAPIWRRSRRWARSGERWESRNR